AVAVGFVLVAASVLDLTRAAMNLALDWVALSSYGLVMLLGLWLIARKLLGLGHGHALAAAEGQAHPHHDHAHAHAHHHAHAHAVMPPRIGADWREELAVVLSVGLRPCTGALVVLVFALS